VPLRTDDRRRLRRAAFHACLDLIDALCTMWFRLTIGLRKRDGRWRETEHDDLGGVVRQDAVGVFGTVAGGRS
jgi:hypothetical protein